MVRLANPNKPGWYWSSAVGDWVETRYDVWTQQQWKAKFGDNPAEWSRWDHFGFRIYLYDEDERRN